MLRKLALFGSTIVLVGSTVFAGSSGASSTIFNTQGASVTCDTIVATAKVIPPISASSTGTAQVLIKGTLGGCTVTGATPSNPTIVSGSISGKITTTGSGGCAGLLNPASISGNIVAKWKVASGQKLDFSSTTLSGGSLQGGVFGGPNSVSYGQFTLSGQSIAPSSAFAGGSPSTTAVTSEDVNNLLNQCNGAGIALIHLGVGNVNA